MMLRGAGHILIEAIKGLKPPPSGDPQTDRWRLFVVINQCAIWVSILLLVLVALGVIRSPYEMAAADTTAAEIEAVAQEAQEAVGAIERAVAEMHTEIASFREEARRRSREILESQMWATMMDMCFREPGRRGAHQQRISDLQSQYAALTGGRFELPSCEEV